MINQYQNRKTQVPVSDVFLKRSSSRAFDSTKTIPDDVLMGCFEAARFAPSSYNNQPWRYLYAKKGSEAFEKILSTLIDFNKAWAKDSQVLIVVCAKTVFEHNQKVSSTASLDTGSSYMSFCIEAYHHGLITHPMEGFSKKALSELFSIKAPFEIQCVLACGYKGDIKKLSQELQDKEALTQRKELKEIVSEGVFDFI